MGSAYISNKIARFLQRSFVSKLSLNYNKRITAAVIVTDFMLGMVCTLTSRAPRAAVVANGVGCADIGQSILDSGGSAADAAIATLLCDGVIMPHSSGIGGGFVATIYTRETRTVEALIARETAPLAATENMYVNKNITGAIAAAVPGEVLGYWHLHNKYGVLPWKQLFQPTIKLCRYGHPVSNYLRYALKKYETRIMNEPSMAEIFVNPCTGRIWEEGDIMVRPRLAETLELIAEEGVGVMYGGGKIAKKLVEDIQELGGIITEKDLRKYDVVWAAPVSATISDEFTLYTTPLPTSGATLVFILNIISAYSHEDKYLFWHYIVESFKHAYAQRTKLGDMNSNPEIEATFKNLISPEFAAEIRELIFDDRTFQSFDYYGAEFSSHDTHGTANIAVLDPQGDAITATSTINGLFGSKVRSQKTGIILNDEMDDFSTPGIVNSYGIPSSPANYIKPRKRPMSSTCPSIILDNNCDVRMLVGASGGSKITTSVAQTIIRYLILGEPIRKSVQSKRLHHQLSPMLLQYEHGFDNELLQYLCNIGHKLSNDTEASFSALTTIGVKNGKATPVCDNRITKKGYKCPKK